MNKIFLVEDHDEVLKVWREQKIKGLDLVHIDAHIDFGFYPAKPLNQIVNKANSLKELKKGLEYSLAFMRYEKDFDKQTNIGNYIYPAMEESIVKNFYWVVPGGLKEFKESSKFIKNTIKGLLKDSGQKIATKGSPQPKRGKVRKPRKASSFAKASEDRSLRVRQKSEDREKGIISTRLLGRNFIICSLERLPVFKQNVLLDIDTDFLVIDSLLNAASTKYIGKRKPWVLPQDLVEILKKRIKNPHLITIAYSVNGGFTPMKYKHLGDEIAYYFAPERFRRQLKNNSQAAEYFDRFTSTGGKEYYHKAVNLNPSYGVGDNNYGPVYLALRKFSLAQKEFLKILEADSKNSACLSGLGNIALERRDLKKAKKYFSSVLNSANHKLFSKVKNRSLLGLAKAEFNLRNFDKAKELLSRYQTLEPLQPQSYYLLGRIFEKEKDFVRSATLYKDAVRLGFGSIEPISRLLRISSHLKEKEAIIKYIIAKYNKFKRAFTREKSLSLKKGKKIKGLRKIENRMASIEKILERKV